MRIVTAKSFANLFIYGYTWIYIHIRVLSGMFIYIYPTPPFGLDMTQGQFFKRSLTGFNSEFSFSETSCLTKAEGLILSYYLPIAGGRIIGFILFPRVLVLCSGMFIIVRNGIGDLSSNPRRAWYCFTSR